MISKLILIPLIDTCRVDQPDAVPSLVSLPVEHFCPLEFALEAELFLQQTEDDKVGALAITRDERLDAEKPHVERLAGQRLRLWRTDSGFEHQRVRRSEGWTQGGFDGERRV